MSESEKERPIEKHADPTPPVDVPDAVRERVRAQASPVRCPFCHDDVRVGEQRWVACAGCLARHHAGCWGEAGRCSACGDAASLAGGRPRSRALAVAAIVGVMLLFFVGSVLLATQRVFTDLRRDLAELKARPPTSAAVHTPGRPPRWPPCEQRRMPATAARRTTCLVPSPRGARSCPTPTSRITGSRSRRASRTSAP